MDSADFALQGPTRRISAARPGVTLHRPATPIRSSTEGLGPVRLAGLLRSRAVGLGFAAVGFTTAEPMSGGDGPWRRWFAEGHHGQMGYLVPPPDRADPLALLPEAKSIVSVALPHTPLSRLSGSSGSDAGRWAAYTQGTDYHAVVRGHLLCLADQLAQWVGRPVVARACVDSAPLLEREVAARSGVGFVGKSTLLIVPGVGSTVVLGELLVDVEIAPDAPQKRSCGRCRRCLDVCPTGAFVGPYLLDARRCISYLTIEHRGSVPREFRPLIGTWVFGCDECQQACPHNFSRAAQSQRSQLGDVAPTSERPSLAELLHLGSSGYRRLVRGTALSRVSRQQLARNAAIALGNSGTVEAVEPLRLALANHPSPLVRGHAAWALGRLHAASEAIVADLETCARDDPAPSVRLEAELALVSCLQDRTLADVPTEYRL